MVPFCCLLAGVDDILDFVLVDSLVHPKFIGLPRKFIGGYEFVHQDVGVDEIAQTGDVLPLDLQLELQLFLQEKPLTFAIMKLQSTSCNLHQEGLFHLNCTLLLFILDYHILRLTAFDSLKGNKLLHDLMLDIATNDLHLLTLNFDQRQFGLFRKDIVPKETHVLEHVTEGVLPRYQTTLHLVRNLHANVRKQVCQCVHEQHALLVVVFYW